MAHRLPSRHLAVADAKLLRAVGEPRAVDGVEHPLDLGELELGVRRVGRVLLDELGEVWKVFKCGGFFLFCSRKREKFEFFVFFFFFFARASKQRRPQKPRERERVEKKNNLLTALVLHQRLEHLRLQVRVHVRGALQQRVRPLEGLLQELDGLGLAGRHVGERPAEDAVGALGVDRREHLLVVLDLLRGGGLGVREAVEGLLDALEVRNDGPDAGVDVGGVVEGRGEEVCLFVEFFFFFFFGEGG